MIHTAGTARAKLSQRLGGLLVIDDTELGKSTQHSGLSSSACFSIGACPTCYGTFSDDVRGNLQESFTLVSGQWVTQDNSYDAFGRRYATSVTTGSGTTPLSYLYDGLNAVLAFNGSSFTGLLLGLDLDELYLENFNGSVQSSLLKDPLGSTVALTDSNQNVKDTYSYEPYGAATHFGTSINGYLFAGQGYDFNNLYFMRKRYYLPAIARFLSRDPVATPGGGSAYGYAGDDPIDNKDPTGLEVFFGVGDYIGYGNVPGSAEGYYGVGYGYGAVEAGLGFALGGIGVGTGGSDRGSRIANQDGVPTPIFLGQFSGGQNGGGIMLAEASGNATPSSGGPCSAYGRACANCGPHDIYDCSIAPPICANTANGPWSNCVRNCLQGMRSQSIKSFGCFASYTFIPGEHGYCFAICP